MVAASKTSTSSFIQDRLEEIRDFRTISGTHAALNLPQLYATLMKEGRAEPAPALAPNNILALEVGDFSAAAVTRKVGMCVISYFAMHAFATLSCYVNGAAGAGKIVLAVGVSAVNYKMAQDLLEEGVFHLLVAVADFAIAYFTLARAALAIAYGISPSMTNEQFGKFYKPWRGPIDQKEGATEAEMEEKRKNYSYLQALADAAQCILFPNGGSGRVQQALAALRGTPRVPVSA